MIYNHRKQELADEKRIIIARWFKLILAFIAFMVLIIFILIGAIRMKEANERQEAIDNHSEIKGI